MQIATDATTTIVPPSPSGYTHLGKRLQTLQVINGSRHRGKDRREVSDSHAARLLGVTAHAANKRIGTVVRHGATRDATDAALKTSTTYGVGSIISGFTAELTDLTAQARGVQVEAAHGILTARTSLVAKGTEHEGHVLEAAIYEGFEVGSGVGGRADSDLVAGNDDCTSFGAEHSSRDCEDVRDEGRKPLPETCPWCGHAAISLSALTYCAVCRNSYRGEDRNLAWVSVAQWEKLRRNVNVGALPTRMTVGEARRRAVFAIEADERMFWQGIADSLQPKASDLECSHNPRSRFWVLGKAPCPTCDAYIDALYGPRREAAARADAERIATVGREAERAADREDARAHCAAMQAANFAAMFGSGP